ncbi:MAG: 4'-phosphopantetheinyl transferase superfamily protein [Niabella sp.]
MPLFFEKNISTDTRLGIWKIAEDEAFFRQEVPLHREVSHPHKRLQHLAGRFLLRHLFPGFPAHLIRIADTRKPYLPNEAYHFSISHCGDFAAAIVSKTHRVGMDIEIPSEKILRVQQKFMTTDEKNILLPQAVGQFTHIWSAKEAVFKWFGNGEVDFKQHIRLVGAGADTFDCYFTKTDSQLTIHLHDFDGLCLAYVVA